MNWAFHFQGVYSSSTCPPGCENHSSPSLPVSNSSSSSFLHPCHVIDYELTSLFDPIRMASISKLQAALASVTNEITLAAANINFDFTLVKYEAPKEFHQLGNSLSKIRIDNAECGPIHMTARRLGALFDGMLPSTPSLLKAYGSRASAIALAAKDTITPEPENSMFAAYGGVDGTSIWAAATSSRSALHVQLLACMLARVWPASEATSVWYELVKERRRDIEQKWKDDEALPFASLTAAVQSDISRANLAEWDASARAWLRTADRVKTKEQDQLMLFIANLNVPININQEMGVYDSVVTAWISALESVDKLVSGTPQAVNSGACLLALSSWHLYPDILMASPTSTSHQFDDPFVKPGGTLTLGLASPGGGSARAAFWSLPLAHLSYYGRPIRREAELDMQSKAITFEQFTCVVFGALLSQWGFQNHQAEIPARFFASLRSSIDRANNITVTPDELYSVNNDDVTMVDEDSDSIGSSSTQTSVPDSPAVEGLHHGLHPSRALKILCRLSLQYLDAHEDRQDPIHKLINLGTKKASKFASNFDSPPTFFELESPTVTLRALRGANERISFLRRIASSAVLPREAYYVRYFVEREQSSLRTLDWRQDRDCGITTAFDETDFTFAHGQASVPRNFRWAPANWHDHGRLTNGETLHPMPLMISRELAAKEKFFTVAEASGGRQTYVLVYGNPNSAALFVNISYIQTPGSQAQQASLPLEIPETIPKVNSLLRGINLEDLIWCLDNDMFQLSSLIQHMDFFGPSSPPQVQLLFCLSAAQCIYGALPNANLTTRALNRPLHLTMWGSQQLQESWKNASTKVQAATAFACVAYMETGMDIDPVHFSRVFAIAYEDSIYVSMQVRHHVGLNRRARLRL